MARNTILTILLLLATLSLSKGQGPVDLKDEHVAKLKAQYNQTRAVITSLNSQIQSLQMAVQNYNARADAKRQELMLEGAKACKGANYDPVENNENNEAGVCISKPAPKDKVKEEPKN